MHARRHPCTTASTYPDLRHDPAKGFSRVLADKAGQVADDAGPLHLLAHTKPQDTHTHTEHPGQGQCSASNLRVSG